MTFHSSARDASSRTYTNATRSSWALFRNLCALPRKAARGSGEAWVNLVIQQKTKSHTFMYTHYSRITPPASALADRNDDIPRRWREKKSGALRKYFAAGLVAVVVLLAPAYTAAQTLTTIPNLTVDPNVSPIPQ